jgi:hypothetical protein
MQTDKWYVLSDHFLPTIARGLMYFATLLVNRHVVRAVCPLPANRITWFNVLCMLTDTWYVLSAHFLPSIARGLMYSACKQTRGTCCLPTSCQPYHVVQCTLHFNRHVVCAVCPLPANSSTWFNVLCK